MCNIFDVEIILKMCKLLEFLKTYKNCFDFKNTKTFLQHKNEDYIIDFILDAKLLYESLYTLSETELNILRNYLLKNSILSRIQAFISCTSASILFVLKKTIIFDSLSIKKNCMLLSLKINARFHYLI